MKLKTLRVNGFRCLSNFEVTFEDGLTLIVGENDCGKTSLIDCLKIIMHNKSVESDDFTHNQNTIVLQIEVEDFTYRKTYLLEGGQVKEKPLTAMPSKDFRKSILDKINATGFDISNDANATYIKDTARLFGISVRINSDVPKLKTALVERLEASLNEPEYEISDARFPEFSNIQLEGRQFENVSAFFKEVFLKEKQASIWQEKIDDVQTIEEFVNERISSYSSEITEEINSSGITDQIKLYVKDLTGICIEPIYHHKDLNIDAKVKFLQDGTEISIEKKGDGTKRRITMALLEHKKNEALAEGSSTMYLLDEPDTHLHVKAQIELLHTLKSFAEQGNQVILTTHSPFIINAVNPKHVRLIEASENGSKLKQLKNDAEDANSILKSLGIENTYLFFAKYIILVEGETEEAFINSYYNAKYRRPISSELIKIINTDGIKNIFGFTTAILELHNPRNILCVYDNDASPDTEELLNRLDISDRHRFVLGNKEFEDCFDSEIIHVSWVEYLSQAGKAAPELWTVENIEKERHECAQGLKNKFSDQLRGLNKGGKKMKKQTLGYSLGTYISKHEKPLPDRLSDLFAILIEDDR